MQTTPDSREAYAKNEDARRLAEATSTAKPMPASQWEDCEACLRRLKESDPILDRPDAMRKSGDVNRVLSILDELERGGNH